jgi:biopolymer transport protein TolR
MSGFTVGSNRGRNARRRRSHRAIAEINVTPFVDVMLVLLIVFMVTAPMLTSGVAVDLPQSQASPIRDEDNKPIEVTLNEDGLIFVGETEVEMQRLPIMLNAITQNNPDRRIYVRADERLDYGNVMRILGTLNKAGLKKVALITKPTK